ncbi:hypothetical protein V2J09_022001 [Rumex salicifolius]
MDTQLERVPLRAHRPCVSNSGPFLDWWGPCRLVVAASLSLSMQPRYYTYRRRQEETRDNPHLRFCQRKGGKGQRSSSSLTPLCRSTPTRRGPFPLTIVPGAPLIFLARLSCPLDDDLAASHARREEDTTGGCGFTAARPPRHLFTSATPDSHRKKKKKTTMQHASMRAILASSKLQFNRESKYKMEGGIGGNMGSIDLSGDKVDLSGQIHHLPCCIKYTGPSEVSDYFRPKNAGHEVDNLVVEEAHFRGRKLLGTTIPIPGGYDGKKNIHNGKVKKVSVRDKSSTEVDSQSNDWEVLAKSHNISVWNHDTVPSKDDPFVRVFHWLTVASAWSLENILGLGYQKTDGVHYFDRNKEKKIGKKRGCGISIFYNAVK